jgi:predicted metal-binding protein
MSDDTLFICSRCRVSRKVKEIDGHRGGALLYETLLSSMKPKEIPVKLMVVECLSACDRHCVAVFSGRGKVTWVFGDLPVNKEEIGESVLALKEFSGRYASSHDGFFERKERPHLLQSGILARIPPLIALKSRPWSIADGI